jgi:hypothetical protein
MCGEEETLNPVRVERPVLRNMSHKPVQPIRAERCLEPSVILGGGVWLKHRDEHRDDTEIHLQLLNIVKREHLTKIDLSTTIVYSFLLFKVYQKRHTVSHLSMAAFPIRDPQDLGPLCLHFAPNVDRALPADKIRTPRMPPISTQKIAQNGGVPFVIIDACALPLSLGVASSFQNCPKSSTRRGHLQKIVPMGSEGFVSSA